MDQIEQTPGNLAHQVLSQRSGSSVPAPVGVVAEPMGKVSSGNFVHLYNCTRDYVFHGEFGEVMEPVEAWFHTKPLLE